MKKHKGFTLVEVLVAMSIASLVLVALFLFFRTGSILYGANISINQSQSEARRVESLIHAALAKSVDNKWILYRLNSAGTLIEANQTSGTDPSYLAEDDLLHPYFAVSFKRLKDAGDGGTPPNPLAEGVLTTSNTIDSLIVFSPWITRLNGGDAISGANGEFNKGAFEVRYYKSFDPTVNLKTMTPASSTYKVWSDYLSYPGLSVTGTLDFSNSLEYPISVSGRLTNNTVTNSKKRNFRKVLFLNIKTLSRGYERTLFKSDGAPLMQSDSAQSVNSYYQVRSLVGSTIK